MTAGLAGGPPVASTMVTPTLAAVFGALLLVVGGFPFMASGLIVLRAFPQYIRAPVETDDRAAD